MSDTVKDYLTFKKMIAPMILHIIFWIGVVIMVIGGLVSLFQDGGFWMGLGMIFLGPLLIRVYVEIFMVMFKINEAVQIIAKK